MERLPAMDMNDPTANYSSIQMPYGLAQGRLLSDWPAEQTQKLYRKALPIDPVLLSKVKMTGNIGYAKVPDGMPRYFPYETQGQPAAKHKGSSRGQQHQDRSRPKGLAYSSAY